MSRPRSLVYRDTHPNILSKHVDKPLRLYVYSYDFDTLREAVVVPNHHWGGEGLLGCVFG